MKYYLNVQFENSRKTYYFYTEDETIKDGDFVLVETVVGLEFGKVVGKPNETVNPNFNIEIKPIVRKANSNDIILYNENKKLSESAAEFFTKSSQELNLDMKLISAQYTIDRTKVLFSYVSADRVDFRELLKILANKLKCRIELKQINPRERAQNVGGIGVCGLPLCCTTFFTSFEGVTMNKVKNQMLAINIPKISGQCGKLMCCLKYEDDLYTESKKIFPQIGTMIKINGTEYKITGFNILSNDVKIENSEEIQYLKLADVNKYLRK